MKLGKHAIVALCGGLVAAGAAGEVLLLPRALPKLEEPLKASVPQGMNSEQLDGILGRVASALPADVRAPLRDALMLESARGGYDPLFLLALVAVESRFRVSVASERGARGLLQLKPSTFAWIAAREPDVGGEDLETGDDPVVDVRLAVRYFRWLEQRFHSRDAALMAYNAGPRRYQQHLRKGEIPESLRDYPRRVMREYTRFVRIFEGKPASGMLLARAP